MVESRQLPDWIRGAGPCMRRTSTSTASQSLFLQSMRGKKRNPPQTHLGKPSTKQNLVPPNPLKMEEQL